MKLRIIFPSVALVVLIVLIIMSLGYPYKTRLFPLLIAIPVAALLAVQILIEARPKGKRETAPRERKIASKVSLATYLRTPASIVTFALLIYLLGYIVGAPLFALLYLKLHGEKWLTTIIYVLAVIALVYGGFWLGFKIPLYEGLLFS